MDLKADLYCISETSATVITQTQVTKSLFEVTKLNARVPRFQIPQALTDSLRFSCCIIHIKQRDVLIIAFYCFPGATRNQNNVRMNDLLLSFVWDVIQNVGLPFIVAGDFNERPDSLPIFNAFRQIGAIEVHQWYQNKYGCQLPATCREATRNDTAIIHPWIAQFLQHAKVHTDLRSGDHSPLTFDFDFDAPLQHGFTWKLPQCWAQYAPPPQEIAYHFKNLSQKFVYTPICSSDDVTNSLTTWSARVEESIHLALQHSHRKDPVLHPWNGLPGKFRGRCQKPDCKQDAPPTSVGGDRPGGYNPPCEIFSVLPKLKVRQVRRLTSLLRNIKACPIDKPHRVADLQLEWDKIRRAQGYGKSWEHWILGFEALPYLPIQLPELDILDTAIAITRIDCDYCCKHEYTLRQKSFKYRMKLDKDQDFSKLTHKLMKDVKTPFLQEIPAQHCATATLCRSVKGLSRIKIQADNIPTFTLNAKATFGDAEILLLQQDRCDITFQHVAGKVPTKGLLCQKYVACSDPEFFDEFRKFWSPYWLRDDMDEQFNSQSFQDFSHEVAAIPMPNFPKIRIPLNDVSLWMDAIANLKSGKAIGICAWRHEELKALPEICVQKLANIFNDALDYQIDGHLMQARTHLLPTCDNPESMNQVRPIAIISSLFRLFGKVVFKAVTKSWSPILPWNVMGGLPGNGVKDLAIYQKLIIEEHVKDHKQLGGYSLDIVKAFNSFGRSIMHHALARLGVPVRISGFWVRCLSRLLRRPEIYGRLGPALPCATGAPEGDCISVLAMIALSSIFYFKVVHVSSHVEPFAYADNWSWMTSDQRSHFKAMIAVLNLASSLKVTINFSKSWRWGTTKEFRNFSETLQLLFPSEQDTIVTQLHVKDLGESVAYGRKVPVDFVRSRVEVASQRIRRLRHLPCSLPDKCLKIQTAAWPAALYAADTMYLRQKHFHDLRKATVHALIGPKIFANAWLAVASLSKYISDPLLYVLRNMARLIRRLRERMPDLAARFMTLVQTFNHSKPYGPASAFKRYCSNIGWTISSDGSLECTPVFKCNILHDPLPIILDTMSRAWPAVLIANIDRKGVGDYSPDLRISHRVFQAFSEDDQKLLSYFFLGSFQVCSIKANWKSDEVPDCPLCKMPDTRPHRYFRYLECNALSHIRDKFQDAIKILSTDRPEWMYIPLARAADDFELCALIKQGFASPEQPKPFTCEGDQTTFFTDGGAINPQYADARIASWAVVQDIATDESMHKQAADLAFCQPPIFPCVKTVAVGLVQGCSSSCSAATHHACSVCH